MTIVSALLVLAAATSLATDRAGNSMEPLVPVQNVKEGEPQPKLCTSDGRFCAFASNVDDGRGQAELQLFEGTAATAPVAVKGLDGGYDTGRFDVWPNLVRLADGTMLTGATQYSFNGYAGGGGSASTLWLYRVEQGKGEDGFTLVFETVLSAGKMIRACFGERDMKMRRGACHDEYAFSGNLALDPEPANGMPRFSMETEATTYPGDVSMDSDSTTRPKLRKSDLVHKRDAHCSYRRVFAFDPKVGTYLPDSPEPDCSDFTVP